MTHTDKNRALAEAFSRHRFTTTYEHLAADVTWTARGGSQTVGRDAVIAACESSAQELGQMRTEFLTFRVVAEGATVVVETVGCYQESEQDPTFVASVDLYDFDDELVTRIVSYAAEIQDPSGNESGR